MKSRLPLGLAALAILFAVDARSHAQPLELLRDLAPGGGADAYDSFGVQPIGAVNGKAILHAPSYPYTLWGSDGSAAGTLPIADLWFGGGAFSLLIESTPQHAYLVLDGVGRVFGARALRTDGTRPGTFFLTDAAGTPLVPAFAPPAGGSGGLYLWACTGETQCGIWFNDGAAAASQLLVPAGSWNSYAIRMAALGGALYWSRDSQLLTTRPGQPGAQMIFGAAGGSIQGLTAIDGRLYFSAASTAGDELWTSDGTSAGTKLLTAFPNASPFGPSISFKAAGGRVYFLADDVVHGQELWSTDGTVAGTRRDTDFGYHVPFGGGLSMGVLGNKLVFAATDGLDGGQLWAQSGSSPAVALLDPCGPDCSPLGGNGLTVAQGRAYFVAADPNHGYEMWSTDGTKAGTRLLVDSCPGSCDIGPPWVSAPRISSVGGKVFFWSANDLWVTDGTPEHTFSVYHSDQYLLDGGPRLVVQAGERFLFPAVHPTYGSEMFVTDGTAGSAELLTQLIAGAASSLPQSFQQIGGRALFSAISDPTSGGASLWLTDGTAAGTSVVPDLTVATCDTSGRLCQAVVVAGDKVFFLRHDDDYQLQLWRADGTAAGTVQVTAATDGHFSIGPAAIGDELYFARSIGGSAEIWSSDGTASGTQALLTVPDVQSIGGLTAAGSELYFVGVKDYLGNVWRSDGTLAGTRKLTDFQPGTHSVTSTFVRAGNAVWFMTIASGVGQLWRTDGTAAGTRIVANPNVVSDLVSFQGSLYFLAQASPTERALWRVNDQQDGILQIARFPGTGFFGAIGAAGLTVSQNALYFAAASADAGLELWRSDGTSAGTTLVRDIRPGPESSGIQGLTATPSGLFFSADEGVHGAELWRSDGTAAGTHLVQDLWPGPAGSYPVAGAVAGNRLVFAATDEDFGREPRSLDLTAARACVVTGTALCLGGGRYRVSADWKDFQGNRGVGHAVGLTADTGYFWFFGPENVEAVIKVLDGRGVNGHQWVFYGALSSVEYTLTVTDTQTGAVRRYFNPSGRLASVGDTQGFGPLGAYSRWAPAAAPGATTPLRVAGNDTSPCVAAATRLCLNGGRFALEASWKDFAGNTGVGHAVALTGDTGYFWFFSDSNVEVVIKVLDGRPLNGKFWVFYGALSSVEYELTLRDTVTGEVRVYRNPSGRMASVADTSAF